MNDLKETLRKQAESLGCAAFGIADLTELSKSEPNLFENFGQSYPRAIVMGIRLLDPALEEIKDQPTILYFHNYKQVNAQLDRLAWMIADQLQAEGHSTIAAPASQIIARNPTRGHISHRKLAVQAGIGFIGRSNLLVHPEYGARMRYVSVLTHADLEPDMPYDGDECGSCRACMAVCPAGAIKEDKADYDLQACYEKLTSFASIPFVGQHICGVCVKACTAKARTQ